MRKYYSLIDKIYRPENLRQAYQHVRSNRGAPGIDGETVEEFGHQLEERLEQIHLELKTGTYQPSPVRRVEIGKEDGGKRPLGIWSYPTLVDTVSITPPALDPPPVCYVTTGLRSPLG